MRAIFAGLHLNVAIHRAPFSGTHSALSARMKKGPSLLLPFSAAVLLPSIAISPTAHACVGISFQMVNTNPKAHTGIEFLTVANGDDTVSTKPKFLIATDHANPSFGQTRPVFSLTADGAPLSVTVKLHGHPSSAPRKITLWQVSPDSELVAGKEYVLTGSIGEPSSIRFKASDAPPSALQPARLVSYDIDRSERFIEFGGTCYPPPYYYGSYEWDAPGLAAVLAYQTNEVGEKQRLLGAWRGSAKDKVRLDSGHNNPGIGCIVLETYAADLSFVATAPACRTYNDVQAQVDGGADAGASTTDASTSTSDAGSDAGQPPPMAAAGCNISAGDVGRNGWSVWGLMVALWLRQRLKRKSAVTV